MLAKLMESPNSDAGFRDGEWSPSAVNAGWATPDGETGKIKWFKITEAGREAYRRLRGEATPPEPDEPDELLAEHQVRQLLRDAVKAAGSLAAFGDRIGVTAQYVHMVVTGKQPPADRILAALGVERRVTYVRVKR